MTFGSGSLHRVCKKMKKILFIGNSYTYVGDLPSVLQAVAAAAGVSVTVSSVTKGGWTLEKHADPADECGARVYAAFAEEKFDYVILQEQSYRPIANFPLFASAVEKLVSMARANGATPILYATWGRAEGCPLLEELGMTNATMTDALAKAYTDVGKQNGARVVHVGKAWQAAKGADLYHADLSHPAPAGTYLAALSFAYGILGLQPEQISLTPTYLSAEADALLKKAAKEAVG